jgi:hypothetical protein
MAASASLRPPERRVRRARGVLWRAGGFGVVLLPPESSEPLTLAGTGPALWEELAEPRTRTELRDRLAGAFAADPDVVAADLEPALAELTRVGAIEEVA